MKINLRGSFQNLNQTQFSVKDEVSGVPVKCLKNQAFRNLATQISDGNNILIEGDLKPIEELDGQMAVVPTRVYKEVKL